MGSLDQDRMEVYQLALDLVAEVRALHRGIPRGESHLVDQINRATESIVCNISEGAGEFSAADKARFYRYALRSATESIGVLDVYRRLELGDADLVARSRALAATIVRSLTGLVKFQETRKRRG